MAEKQHLFGNEDCSVFVGLTSMPLGQERQFIKEEFTVLFNNFKKGLVKHSSASKREYSKGQCAEFKKFMYRPSFYILQGDYDLACISLIEEFTLGNQVFHPYNKHLVDNKKEQSSNNHYYNFQVLTGLSSRFLGNKETLLPTYNRLFPSTKGRLNARFIGICRLKLNNTLLISNGLLYKQIVLESIHEFFKKIKEKKKWDVDFISFDSFSCHELTLIITSDIGFYPISEIIVMIREWNLDETLALLSPELKRLFAAYVLEFLPEKKSGTRDVESIKTFLSNHSLYDAIATEKLNDIGAAHIFVNTQTILGFSAEPMMSGKQDEYSAYFGKKEDKNVSLNTNWFVKPGHLHEFLRSLKKIPVLKQTTMEMIVGKGVYIQPPGLYKMEKMPEIIKFIHDNKDSVSRHVRKIASGVQVNVPVKLIHPKKGKSSDSPIIIDTLKAHPFTFSPLELDRIRDGLQKLWIARVLRERIINMFIDYNDGISDPVLYGHYIELRPFLDFVKQYVNWAGSGELKDENRSLEERHKTFLTMVELFDKANVNRFRQSYRMLEVTDNTLEHNGGIQQLISGFDASYKSISFILGDNYFLGEINKRQRSFAFVDGFPGVEANLIAVRLNYFHIFQCEIYAIIAAHEAANYYLQNVGDLKSVFKERSLLVGDGNLRAAKLAFCEWRLCSDLSRQLNLKSSNDDEDADDEGIPAMIMQKESQFKDIVNYSKYIKFFQSEKKSPLSIWGYVLTDSLTYTLGYNRKDDLFWYYHWGTFSQLYFNYTVKGKFEENNFLAFLIRFVLVMFIYDDEAFLNSQSFNSPYKQLNDLWRQHFSNVVNFVRLIVGEGSVIGNEELAKLKTTIHCIIRLNIGKEISFTSNGRSLGAKIESKVVSAVDSETDFIFPKNVQFDHRMLSLFAAVESDRNQLMERLSVIFTPYIEKGHPIDFFGFCREVLKESNVSSDEHVMMLGMYASGLKSLFAHSLNYIYLNILFKHNQPNGRIGESYRKNCVLFRNSDGKISHVAESDEERGVMKSVLADYLFDPFGGVFTHHPNVRRSHFKYRSAYYQSLWDLAQFNKKQMLKELSETKSDGKH